MGKSTPSAPAQPSASSIAGQQQASNVNTAIANAWLNNTNQVTPWGSVTYRNAGNQMAGDQAVPQFVAETQLSPGGQKLYDLSNRYIDRIGEATSKPFTYEGMPAAPNYDQNYRQHTYDSILQRAAPQQERDRQALVQRLADQGISLTDPAYATAMRQFDQGINDFRLGADTQAQQSAATDYGLQADARARAIQEAVQLRQQPINEVAALTGASSGGQLPQFQQTPTVQVAPTDVIGAYGQQQAAALQRQQMAMQQQAATTGGLFGLGSAALTGWGLGGFKKPWGG